MGRGRAPPLGLPQRVRLDAPGTCAPGDREGRRGAGAPRHAFRGPDRGRHRGRRGACAPLRAAEMAVQQLGLRGDDGRDPNRPRSDGARHVPQDLRLVPRPSRRGHGRGRRRRHDRRSREHPVDPLWRRCATGRSRPHRGRPLQRCGSARAPHRAPRRRGPQAGLPDHGGGADEHRRRHARGGVPRGRPRHHAPPRGRPHLRRGQDRSRDRRRRRHRALRRPAGHGHAREDSRRRPSFGRDRRAPRRSCPWSRTAPCTRSAPSTATR